MTREKRLGRGLEALLGRKAEQPSPPTQVSSEAVLRADIESLGDASGAGTTGGPEGSTAGPYNSPRKKGLVGAAQEFARQHGAADGFAGPSAESRPVSADVGRIDSNPFQPRQDFDPVEMKSLAESLKAHGLLQPVVVRQVGDRYQLIAGERRLRAAMDAGWTEVPIQVVEADDREVAELAIIENLQRKDLNPLEKATSFQRYLEEYGGTQEDLASRLKLDRSTIANLIRLLELPESVQDAIRRGRITQGHARALLPLGDEPEQIAFCKRIQQDGLSVRQTENLVQETIEAADAEPLALVGRDGRTSRARQPRNEQLAALEQEFRAALGTKVKVTHSSRGRGKLVIHFRSHEEFERLRRYLIRPEHPDTQARAV